MSNFDPIPRLQQIAATIEDGGHFDSPATAAHYINCAIREIERLRQEYGEARRAIGESLQSLIHLRQEQNALRDERDEARKEAESWQDDALRMMRDRNTAERERDEAQRECCVRTVDAGGNPAQAPLEEAIAEAKRRGWKCYRTAEDA